MKGSYVQPEIDWNSMSAAPVGVIQRSRKAKAWSDVHETLQHEGYLDSEINWLCGDPTLIARPGFIASSGSRFTIKRRRGAFADTIGYDYVVTDAVPRARSISVTAASCPELYSSHAG